MDAFLTTDGLATGAYFGLTRARTHTNEIYDDIACPAGCSPSRAPAGTPIVVTSGATTSGRNFVLAPRGGVPGAPGGLAVYVAFQRALTDEGQTTRIGEYDVSAGTWRFFFYALDENAGGASGNTFLSELLHVSGDRFAVIERDQGYAGEARKKVIRTFTLASGTAGNLGDPVDKVTAVDLLATPFRFDQEKIEGLALGGGALWVTNDNDGGQAANFFLRLDPALLEPTPPPPPPPVPGQGAIVINEVRSQGVDFVELYNRGTVAVDLAGWQLTDNDPTHVYAIPAGVTIAPGGRVVVEGDTSTLPSHLTFGLGSADSAILYTPTGVLEDSYAWTAAINSASRCPEASGPFVAPTTATR